jgi:hypothetical protein
MFAPSLPAPCARLGHQARRSSSSAAAPPRRCARANAAPEDEPAQPAPETPKLRKAPPTSNLYDPVASLSRFLTRRFGIVGGLSLFAVLAVTEGAEIVRALLEERGGGEVAAVPRTLASGLVLTDTKLGAGAEPQPGDFLGMQLTVSTTDPTSGETVYLLGSAEGGRAASLVFNKAKASSLAGLEEGLQGMKRGGVREVVIPANVGLRAKVAGLPSGPSPFPLRVLVKLEEVSPSYAFS